MQGCAADLFAPRRCGRVQNPAVGADVVIWEGARRVVPLAAAGVGHADHAGNHAGQVGAVAVLVAKGARLRIADTIVEDEAALQVAIVSTIWGYTLKS